MRGLIVDLFVGGDMITCPYDQGETDHARCVGRAAAAQEGTGCLLCPVPPLRIAQGGEDETNRRLAAWLPKLRSCPWTPPAVKRPLPPISTPKSKSEPRPTLGRIMALAFHKSLGLGAPRAILVEPAPAAGNLHYNPGRDPLSGAAALYRALRRFGLPVTRSAASSYGVARSMANTLQTIAASSKDLLHQIIGSLSHVRAKTLAAIKEAKKGTSLQSARRSAVARKAANVRWAGEREKQAAAAKGSTEKSVQ